mmetsp:Transcript_10573/g.21833  ORF Transcript_10573/g.21833 Transcript_10573/m.21833 type:complete len:155 (+) Transcript_10573:55-519(+)
MKESVHPIIHFSLSPFFSSSFVHTFCTHNTHASSACVHVVRVGHIFGTLLETPRDSSSLLSYPQPPPAIDRRKRSTEKKERKVVNDDVRENQTTPHVPCHGWINGWITRRASENCSQENGSPREVSAKQIIITAPPRWLALRVLRVGFELTKPN